VSRTGRGREIERRGGQRETERELYRRGYKETDIKRDTERERGLRERYR
jgi:hypothetical protein